MVAIDPKAKYHRTLDIRDNPYIEYLPGLTAYTFRGQTRIPIKYDNVKGRDFKKYATAWEIFHSKVPYGEGRGNAFPVVDDEGLVVGHYGTFDSSEIFIPAEFDGPVKTLEVPDRGTLGLPRATVVRRVYPSLQDILATGADVIADKYMEDRYKKRGFTQFPQPQLSFTLMTDIEGYVLLVLSKRDKESLESVWYDPLNLTIKGGLIAAQILLVLESVELPAVGALVLRNYLAKRAVQVVLDGIADAGASDLVAVAARRVARRVGRLTAEEMEQHLGAVLAARSDLRRLMAARVMTGQGRMDAIKIALQEFERTQGWKVVEKTAAEMEAVTTPNNIVHMRAGSRELWINSERHARWDPEEFYEHVVHDLGAHALAGRGGTLTEADIPFVGVEFRGGITDALTLLERTIRREGVTSWISRTFGGR